MTDKVRELSPEEIAANVEKVLAEASVHAARAAKFAAEARKAEAEADAARADANVTVLEADAKRRYAQDRRDLLLASDRYHRVYQFRGNVTDGSVDMCMDTLTLWHREDAANGGPCEMEIVFYSPGGVAIPGMRLFDHILWLRSLGHSITTTALGQAASMGGVLLQAGDKRVIGRESYVLIHELSFGAEGSMGEVEDEVAMAKMVQRRVVNIFCSRAKDTGRKGYLTPAVMVRRWARKDWWLDSDECYRLGVVDEIR